MRSFLAALVLLAGPAALAEPVIALNLPIDCDLGEDKRCYIQNYVDEDPGAEAQDHTCNGLTYDGHKGTDFALRNHEEIAAGVDVLAAADGVVTGIRDGMVDRLFESDETTPMDGRDCGNGVVIDHGNGWETQYCHMRQGSIAVATGDRVVAGTPLGMVGLSGRTQFPHLHLSVRRGGQVIDPFSPDPGCGDDSAALWVAPPIYQPGGLIAAGFFPGLPDYPSVKTGEASRTEIDLAASALVLWGFAFGTRAGDVMKLTILGPEGLVLEEAVTFDKSQAQSMRAAGRKTLQAEWFTDAVYRGRVELIRAGVVISDLETEVTVIR